MMKYHYVKPVIKKLSQNGPKPTTLNPDQTSCMDSSTLPPPIVSPDLITSSSSLFHTSLIFGVWIL